MRNLALMWVVAGVVSFAAVQADTVQSWKSGETTATLTDDGTLRVSGNGAMMDHYYYIDPEGYWPQWCRYLSEKVSVTKAVIGDSVTHIGNNTFGGCCELMSIAIGNSVASIGSWAFITGCDNQMSIEVAVAADNAHYYSEDGVLFNKNKTTLIRYPGYKQGPYVIPDNVMYIDDWAFYQCDGLTSVTFLKNLKIIGGSTFRNCNSLTSITIPNSVASIGDRAFSGCENLTSVTIGNSVASIGSGVFLGCGNLTSIEIAADNAHYISEDGVIFNKNKTALIHYPMSRQGPYVIPNSVMYIDDGAFYKCDGLTSVTFPKNLKILGEYTFRNCNGLTSVTIPKSVRIIGTGAFYACTNLMSVTIPKNVRIIGAEAFANCDSLKLITFHGLILPKFGYGALVLSTVVFVIFIIIIIIRKSRKKQGKEKRK